MKLVIRFLHSIFFTFIFLTLSQTSVSAQDTTKFVIESVGNGVSEIFFRESFPNDVGMLLRYNGRQNGGQINKLQVIGFSNGQESTPHFEIQRDSGYVRLGKSGEDNRLLILNLERSWAFSQHGTGANTALKLESIGGGGNKNFLIDTDGFVGIGDDAPVHQVSLGAGLNNIKLALYEKADNTETYGIGVTADRLRFNLGNPEAVFSFFDDDGPTPNEIFTIEGNGTVRVMGSTVHSSDRNRKEKIIDINENDILTRINALPIYEWQYKTQSRRHIGPMAQDFHDAFGLGKDNTSIASIDADGVALAGVKALIQEIELLKKEIAALKTGNAE